MTGLQLQRDADVADRLGRAFAVWRLRPGEPDQPTFITATERLSEAVTPRSGLTLGIRGAGFVTADDVRVDQRAAGALAEALYRLGIERLHLHRAPTPAELDRFFAAADVAGDREELHARLGPVNAILEPISVAPTAAGRDEVEHREGWREIWEALADPAASAQRIMGPGDPEPADVVRRLEALRSALPEARQRSPILADRLHGLVLQLPDELRRAVARDLIGTPDTAFPGWLLCSLTDHDLGLLLQGVDDDVAGLARRALGRQLGDLTTEVVIPARPDDRAAGPVAPGGGAGGAPLSAESLELFLGVEHRPARLRAALLHWERRVREAVHGDQLDEVQALLGLLHRVAAVTEHDVIPTLDAAVADALGPDDVAALLPPVGDPLPPRVEQVLRDFGFVAVDALLRCLVHEEDAHRRAQIVAVLAKLVPGNTNALAPWIEDGRWYVVRNVVTALWRAADPAAIPLLERAMRNDEPRVRLETARALAGVGAVPQLTRLAADPDAEVRTSARRMLSGLGSAQAAAGLAALAGDEGLSLTDRRSVLDALAQHPRGGAHLATLADDRDLPLRLRWHAGRLTSEGRR